MNLLLIVFTISNAKNMDVFGNIKPSYQDKQKPTTTLFQKLHHFLN